MENMTFLTVYEVDTKEYKQYDEKIKRVFIQEDVWDFHLFRVIEEGNGFLLEMDNIGKDDLAEKMNLNINNDVRHLFKKIPASKVCKEVVDFDVNRGFETYESTDCDSIEEVMETITEDMYTLVNLCQI
jgi:hypothetical protein